MPGLDELSPLLIANRGEIAIRIARSARALGIAVVGVYCEPDRDGAHVEVLDAAALIDSYLSIEQILAAAKRLGARSIHPGYGFLSENAGFAAAVIGAGLAWVGPPPAVIEAMADKARAKQLAAAAGVAVIEGAEASHDGDVDRTAARAFADLVGYPILIKALSGGGGKGMRVVRAAAELEQSLAAARREGVSAFGDGRVLVERYLERPRHIEVQLLADNFGNVVHLGERECSLQRRHQKVIEEAPSPALEPAGRDRIGAAAVALAKACGYVGVGTVEFVADSAADNFYFCEMNTRLQVEHPVTEAVWGVDLVDAQLRVAAGERLGFSQADLSPSGHAVEARIYAEDPAAGFLPASGRVMRWRPPGGEGIRVESGVRSGSEIVTDYDPMIAKLIVSADARLTALARLDRALAELVLLGPANNVAFLRAVITHPEVRAGKLDTGFLERARAELTGGPPEDLIDAAALQIWLEDSAGDGSPAPWRRSLAAIGEVAIIDRTLRRSDRSVAVRAHRAGDGADLIAEIDGVARRYSVERDGEAIWVGRGGEQFETAIEPPGAVREHASAGSLAAPMPGTVLELLAINGDSVSQGATLLILESMKMELAITAPSDGVVAGLELAVGDRVGRHQVMLEISTPLACSDGAR